MQTPSPITPRSALTGNILLMAVLLMLDSLHFVFARSLLPYVAPRVSVTLVLAVSTIEVGLFGLATRRLHWNTARKHFWFFAAIGTLIAGSTAINYEAVAFIDPGTASLLSQTSVLFSLAFGILWLGDRLTQQQVWGALLALGGVFVVSFQPGDYLRFGSLLIVGAALMYALHAALTKRHSNHIDLVDFFFFRLLFTTAALSLAAVARSDISWPTPRAWAQILLVGTVDVVLSRTLYYLALRRLTMSMHTIILTVSPIAAITWSRLLFGTLPTRQQLLGGAAIVMGVLIVSLARPRSRQSQVAISLQSQGEEATNDEP